MGSKEKVVAVSGGFDPIHIGHVRNFKEAKRLGDRLIVILNSDRFLIEKKGYVFMPYKERKEILEAIRWVDKVVPCIDKDESVAESLKHYKPDIFAKGGDRKRENLPPQEASALDEEGIRLVSGVGGGKIRSSSKLIEDVVKRLKNKER